MRVRCAWCQKLLTLKAPLTQDKTSHSICRECLRLNLTRQALQEKDNATPRTGRGPAHDEPHTS